MTSEFAIAVHAIVYLNHRQESLSSEEIAENVCVHPVRLRKILARLKKAGLVATKEGIHGGYRFEKDPEEVDLYTVCQAIGEEPVEVKSSTGDVDMDCQIASGMAGIMDQIYGEMNQACYGQLKQITIYDIDKKIFKRGD
ncbi:MAG: Rrf2 family transcriptional regulator [Megasphaera sp.]|jgi:Rrf2 family protein|nr:Rrf2 family transcriptional regulator [Megasphaera sp.]MCH4187819.1 Rrf2 family transcriptional regulator [Megasphaera sp.]MCH4218008.1 Rrf2 family transcriptional regulator [Megasphaera sp.]